MNKIILMFLLISMIVITGITIYAKDDGTDVNITFGGGAVKISDITINDFGFIELTGTDQIAETNISDFTITDPRGNGKGWILQISATPFSNGINQLHDGALSITETKGNAVGKSDPFNQSYINNPFTIREVPGNYIIVPESNGKGTYIFNDAKLSLEIWPSEVYAGTYSTTITFDMVQNIS